MPNQQDFQPILIVQSIQSLVNCYLKDFDENIDSQVDVGFPRPGTTTKTFAGTLILNRDP